MNLFYDHYSWKILSGRLFMETIIFIYPAVMTLSAKWLVPNMCSVYQRVGKVEARKGWL